MKISTMIRESWLILSKKFRTVIFCKKLGWLTFSSTRRTSMGKNIPISSFNPDLNLTNNIIKMEHWSWKIAITDNAVFFISDKHRNCLIVLRNLYQIEENVILYTKEKRTWKRCQKIVHLQLMMEKSEQYIQNIHRKTI